MSLLGRRDEVQEAAGADVEVRIRGLMMDQSTHTPIVVLNDLAGEVMLPIWVGLFEASAIAMEIEKATTPRPMTHDLLRDVIHGLDAKVKRVVVGSLEENTFHASIWMEQQGAGAARGLPDLCQPCTAGESAQLLHARHPDRGPEALVRQSE
jgi:hypothetical protein